MPFGVCGRNCRQVAGGLDLGSLTGARGQYVDPGAHPTGGGLDGIPDVVFAQFAVPGSTQGNQYNARFDFTPAPSDSIAFSTYITSLNSISADSAGGSRPLGDIPFKPLNSAATLTYNRTISPTMLNEARFNVTRFAEDGISDASNVNFGIPRLEVEGLALPDRIRFGAPQSETTPSRLAQNQFELRDNLSKVLANHALRFGAELRWEQDNNSLVGGARPLYSFQGLFNLANDTPVFEQINANPVTGAPADAQRYLRTHTYSLYAQDEWKLRPDFTLTLGLRWEYFSPITEKSNRLSNLIYASPYTLLGARVETVSELFHRDRNNFAPRLGFAYNPSRIQAPRGAGWIRSVLPARAGCAVREYARQSALLRSLRNLLRQYRKPFCRGQILYALGSGNSIYSYPANPALALGIDPNTGGVLQPHGGGLGDPAEFPHGLRLRVFVRARVQPPKHLVASAGYQGSTDHHLIRIVNQNFLYANNPAFGPVYFPQPDVNSNYNALNLSLARSFSAGVGVQANYRWSKSIDQVSTEGPGAASNQTYPQDNRTSGAVRFRRHAFSDRGRAIRTAVLPQSAGTVAGGVRRIPDRADSHLSHGISLHQ